MAVLPLTFWLLASPSASTRHSASSYYRLYVFGLDHFPAVAAGILLGAAWDHPRHRNLEPISQLHREYAHAPLRTVPRTKDLISLVVVVGIIAPTLTAVFDHRYRLFVASYAADGRSDCPAVAILPPTARRGYVPKRVARLRSWAFFYSAPLTGHFGLPANDPNYRPVMILVLLRGGNERRRSDTPARKDFRKAFDRALNTAPEEKPLKARSAA